MSAPWAVAAVLTLAASVHCVGMCGGFVLALSAPQRGLRLKRLVDQLVLQIGKASTYAFLGTLAGALGAAFVGNAWLAWAGRALALGAGLALIAAGCTLLGLRGRSGSGFLTQRIALLWSQWLGPILTARPSGASLVVGMAMGLLPCPLVYAGLAAAAASGSAAVGAATMAGVALGTLPALTLVALFGSSLPQTARHTLARAAGVLLVVVGVITAARGLDMHAHHHAAGPVPSAEHSQHH